LWVLFSRTSSSMREGMKMKWNFSTWTNFTFNSYENDQRSSILFEKVFSFEHNLTTQTKIHFSQMEMVFLDWKSIALRINEWVKRRRKEKQI
jgi:hypothetical protein